MIETAAPGRTSDLFGAVRAIADAVLLEGYLLYPYRSTAPKNQIRWSFGVLAPQTWSESGGDEAWWMQTQVPLEGAAARIDGRLRFLRIQTRTVERYDATAGTFQRVDRLEVGGELYLSWDEATIEEVPFVLEARQERLHVEFALPSSRTDEILRDASGTCVGRLVRRKRLIDAALHVRAVPLGGGLRRLEIRVENHTPCAPAVARDLALRSACLSAHLLLAAEDGAFVSLLDPAEPAAQAAKSCNNVRSFPVLAGPAPARHLVLASPFILYDHPRLAPESPGDLFDATEIDELLSLRTATLTEEEKRVARATDPRAAAILDRVESMLPPAWERLHGAVREIEREEMVPRPALGVGARVRLRAPTRRTDAQDLLYVGLLATVEKVVEDVDGSTFLAVTIDGDPAAELNRWYGRFHYYRTDEVELVERAP